MSEQTKREVAMKKTLLKIKVWLTKLAANADDQAKTCQFVSLKKSYIADAKNYHAVVKEIDAALSQAQQP